MPDLFVDIETFSSANLKSSGLYRYAQSPDFQVLLFGYAFDEAPAVSLDLLAAPLPQLLVYALFDPSVTKHAHNAAFEWYCLSVYFKLTLEQASTWAAQWRDTLTRALYCGYPGALEAAGAAMGLDLNKQKMASGHALIMTFCVPHEPARKNGFRTRTLPKHEPERWESFKEYNARDVEAERAVYARLAAFPLPPEEERLWQLDLLINARGVGVDMPMVEGAIDIGGAVNADLQAEAVQLSGLENPNSQKQLLAWLNEELPEDEEIEDIQKATIRRLLESGIANERVERMLQLRLQLGKTSTTKYAAIQNAVGTDSRVRGLFQFYGANRTGRFAGRLVQVQNLPRNHLPDLDHARELTRAHNRFMLSWLYPSVPDTLSQLIRTAFVPSPGNKFIVADFSAIEARVIAWLAGEQWVMDVFAGDGKIYEATYAQMFSVPVESVKKGSDERQIGKIAQLALGFQGAVHALEAMMRAYNVPDEVIPLEQRPIIVKRWRKANPHIVSFWYDLQRAAIETIQTGTPRSVGRIRVARELDWQNKQDFLTLQLPSGRRLFYCNPRLVPNAYDSFEIIYSGVDQIKKQWGERKAYGGLLVENVVQATARDCLTTAMSRLTQAGYTIVMHVHDEVIVDAPAGASVDAVCDIMGQPIPWAPGLPLPAAGFETPYYKKD